MRPTALIAPQIAALALLSLPAGAAPPPLPRGTEIRVNTDTTVSHLNPSVAAFPDGGFVVVWTADPGGVRARLFDSLGRPASGEMPLKVGGPVDDVVADRDGSFLVVWSASAEPGSPSNVYVRRFLRSGTPRGRALRANAPSRSGRRGGVATIGPDGRIAVAWQSDVPMPGSEGICTDAVARIFTASGAPATPEIVLLPGSPAGPAGDDQDDALPTRLTLAPDGTLTALVKYWTSCVRSFLAQVPPEGGEPRLRGLGSLACSLLDSSSGSLAMGLDGSLIAAWREYEVQVQRFARNGTPRGERFLVSEELADRQSDPAIALQAGGSFVVVWTAAKGQEGEGTGIFGRAFAADGTPRSPDFQVNTTAAGDQFDPAIAAPRRGPVLVVWSQTLEEGGRGDVFARVLAANP